MAKWWENGSGGASWDAEKAEAATAPPPAQDANDAWASSWGQKAAAPQDSWGSAPAPATAYWEEQRWNVSNNVLSRKADWELDQDEQRLFNADDRNTAGLNFDRYENVPVDLSGSKAELIPVCRSFEEMFQKFKDLMPPALEGNLRRLAYQTPTPVQRFAIPVGLCSRDVMCCAQTGSGKTAAFLIPTLGRLLNSDVPGVFSLQVPFQGVAEPSCLVLSPTRELCIQIHEEAMKFLHRTDYRTVCLYGGAPTKEQMKELSKGVDVLVATPGRCQDFINRGILTMRAVRVLVLDEADRMLDMGFEHQIREIVEKHEMPGKEGQGLTRQTMMFSATFPEACQQLAQEFLFDYIWIAVGVIGSAVETVEQELLRVAPEAKFDEMIRILDNFYQGREETGDKNQRMLVFANTKDTAKYLDEQLYGKHFDTGALHGGLDQKERETNLTRFRKGEIDVMIATDVAARGLDIPRVSIVLNYDLPNDVDTYIHRIGRTGRIGNTGKAITFVSCQDGGAGPSLEKPHLLKGLNGVLTSSNQAVPDWLGPLIEGAEAGNGSSSWSWESKPKDTRSGVEASRWSSSGDAWANWGSTQDRGAEAARAAPAAGDAWQSSGGGAAAAGADWKASSAEGAQDWKKDDASWSQSQNKW